MPCNDGQQWKIQAMDCPGDVWSSFRNIPAHAVALVYIAVYVLTYRWATDRDLLPLEAQFELIVRVTLLWLSVISAIRPYTGCPTFAAFQIYRTQVALPLLLLSTFEVTSFVLGVFFCESFETTIDRVRWS
eukprot:10167706-Ditylum_brightwellii.AAC.1